MQRLLIIFIPINIFQKNPNIFKIILKLTSQSILMHTALIYFFISQIKVHSHLV